MSLHCPSLHCPGPLLCCGGSLPPHHRHIFKLLSVIFCNFASHSLHNTTCLLKKAIKLVTFIIKAEKTSTRVNCFFFLLIQFMTLNSIALSLRSFSRYTCTNFPALHLLLGPQTCSGPGQCKDGLLNVKGHIYGHNYEQIISS